MTLLLLQPWKHSLHVPLRIDVFYSHYPRDKNSEERILLERWCIDYVSNHECDEQHQNTATALDNTEMLSQLRQVCKKIMIALRTIYCYARMLPAYQLHCYLTQGIPLGIQRSQERGKLLQQLQQHPVQPSIGYTFYAAPQHHDDAADTYLQRNQFQRYLFRGIPTPYGILQMSVWYHPQSNNIVLSQINSVSAAVTRTGPIEIPKQPKQRQHEEFYHTPVSQPSSSESGVHEFLIPNYSPTPESLFLKQQHQLKNQRRQRLLQQDLIGKSNQFHHESSSPATVSDVERHGNIKTSMSGLSLALLQDNVESQSLSSPPAQHQHGISPNRGDHHRRSHTQSPARRRTSTITDQDYPVLASEATTAVASNNHHHRSHSVSYPVSFSSDANNRPIAIESGSPCTSYQPQPTYMQVHGPSQAQAKSFSPRFYHMQQNVVNPTQPPLSQPSDLCGTEQQLHGHGYGYGYNNPSPPNASSAVPIARPQQDQQQSHAAMRKRTDSTDTARSGAALHPSASSVSSSPRYLSSSPAPFLLQAGGCNTSPLVSNFSATSPTRRSSLKKSISSRMNSGGVGCVSDSPVSRPPSPPFVSHPMTLQYEGATAEKQHRRQDTFLGKSTGEGPFGTATVRICDRLRLVILSLD